MVKEERNSINEAEVVKGDNTKVSLAGAEVPVMTSDSLG